MTMIGSFTPDVLLTDMGLPDGSGDKLFSTLRKSHPNLVGIAITGFGMEEDIARSREVGFASHFTKPIDFSLLRDRLTEIATPADLARRS
jgi:DNA-binding response OmpR family regulator